MAKLDLKNNLSIYLDNPKFRFYFQNINCVNTIFNYQDKSRILKIDQKFI